MNDDEEMSVVFGVLYFENPWLLSWLEWSMVSVVVARSGDQSLQPARWIGVFVVVARSDEYWTLGRMNIGLYVWLSSP